MSDIGPESEKLETQRCTGHLGEDFTDLGKVGPWPFCEN